MSRRYAGSDVSVDRRYEDREYVSRGGRSRIDDRFVEEDVVSRSRGPARDRIVREEVIDRERERSRDLPFLREDYGRPTAGAMVLAKRETEDFEFAPRPRRRSPSPEPERKVEKEEIIIRSRDESERPPIRERSREREEIIIRKDERDRDYPPRREERDREEIIIRKDERDRDYGPRRDERDREEIIIRRDERDDDVRSRGFRDDHNSREEIIIRRDERDDDVRSRGPRDERTSREEIIIKRNEDEGLRPRPYDDYALTRRVSRERERSRRRGSESDEEIIIRRDEREGRGGEREREEIIIRKHSRSPSPSSRSTLPPALEPPAIYAPPIHREVITHYRNVDHGFEVARPRSRPPSPPMPPPPRERSEERIEIHRTGEKNGRAYDEDIIIDRNEGGASRARTPVPLPVAPYVPDYPPGRLDPSRRYEREEEADYYNRRAMDRGYMGEAYNGATRNWGIVDVPPGTERVRMNGIGGGEQEITWQRYNGVRRSQFYPDSSGDPGYAPLPGAGGEIGPRFGRPRDPKEGLWTEITKDLVVKEAIKEMGYEYEETDDFYYIMKYLRYEDVARLVGLSEDIRKDRYKRAREMEWENRVMPPPAIEEPRPRLYLEGPSPRRDHGREHERSWDREDERYIEREVVYRGGPPPGRLGPPPRLPPSGWPR